MHKASADAAAFILRDRIHVDTVCTRARAWRVADALWVLLDHVDAELQVPVPWRARLAPSRMRRMLMHRLARGDLPGTLVRPLATDDRAAGTRYLLTSLPRALRTAFAMLRER